MKVIHYTEVESQAYPGNVAKGAMGRVVIGQADGASNFCMRVFELEPGGFSADHDHDFEHEVFVHAGKGVVMKEGKPVEVGPGSVIFIPGGERHQLKNIGEEKLVFACLIPSGWPEL